LCFIFLGGIAALLHPASNTEQTISFEMSRQMHAESECVHLGGASRKHIVAAVASKIALFYYKSTPLEIYCCARGILIFRRCKRNKGRFVF
jgi:hypothetical protein